MALGVLSVAAPALFRTAPQAYSFLKQHWGTPEDLKLAEASLKRGGEMLSECVNGGLYRRQPGLVQPLLASVEQLASHLEDAKLAHEKQSLWSWLGTADLQSKVELVDKQVKMLQSNVNYQKIALPVVGNFVQVVAPGAHSDRRGQVIEIKEHSILDATPCKVRFADDKHVTQDWLAFSDLQVLMSQEPVPSTPGKRRACTGSPDCTPTTTDRLSVCTTPSNCTPGATFEWDSCDFDDSYCPSEISTALNEETEAMQKQLLDLKKRRYDLKKENDERQEELDSTRMELVRQRQELDELAENTVRSQEQRDEIHKQKKRLKREVYEAEEQKEDLELQIKKVRENVERENTITSWQSSVQSMQSSAGRRQMKH